MDKWNSNSDDYKTISKKKTMIEKSFPAFIVFLYSIMAMMWNRVVFNVLVLCSFLSLRCSYDGYHVQKLSKRILQMEKQ